MAYQNGLCGMKCRDRKKKQKQKKKQLSDYFIYDTLECRLNTHCHLFSTGEEQKKSSKMEPPGNKTLILPDFSSLSPIFLPPFFWKKN